MSSIKGLNQLEKKLNHTVDVAKEYEQPKSVNFGELFSDSFMLDNTKFKSINEFLEKLGVKNQHDFEELPQETLENQVRSETNFDSWKDMKQAATNTFFAKKLGF
ncbi:hypothetical protein ACW5BZ_08145 [Pediococcus pentosaceus]